MFREKMLSAIKKYSMLKEGDKVLVALSGGADSVSLLLGLLELKDKFALNIEAAHVNHLLRGEDAENDMNFAIQLCDCLGIKLHILKKDVNEYSRINKCSCEDAGRRVRYEFFNSIKADKLATAHTCDDNGESFFISALRGTRIMGIPPVRGNIIRPLIFVTKREIYEYLEEKNQSFCVDKTNFSDDFFRNKVRLKLIPYINGEFEMNIAEGLGNNLDILFEENNFLSDTADEFISESCEMKKSEAIIDIDAFNKLHTALKRRTLRNIYYKLTDRGYISYTHTENIIKLAEAGKTGKKLPLSGNITAEISYKSLILKKNEKKFEYSYFLSLENSLEIKETQTKITLSKTNKSECFFYSDETEFCVRTRKNGDKLTLKNRHHKKLSDFFTDRKIPRSKRCELPIICGKDEIYAVGTIYLNKNEKNDKNKVYIHIERTK